MLEMPIIPANVKAEQAILACIFYNPRNIAKVVDVLRPTHFHMSSHSTIYKAMLTLHEHERSCTLPNVAHELARHNELEQFGGQVQLQLEEIADNIALLGNIEDYAEQVRKAATFRKLYDLSASIADAALHQDENALEMAEQAIYDIALDVDTKSVMSLADVMPGYLKMLEDRVHNFRNNIANGVPSGFSKLDEMLGGLQPSNLYILAARPSIGKTALSLNITWNMVQNTRHVLFFSLEMDNEELMQRLVSMDTHIDQSFLRDGDVSDDQLAYIRHRAKSMSKLDLKVDDRTYTLSAIKSKAKRVHAKKKLDLIVVDYLQLIDTPTEERSKQDTRALEVARLSKGLKKLARELKVPILALAQLNREGEGQAPLLKHLGESDGLAKDPDVVMMLHIEELELAKREECKPYRVNVIVRKHRNGRVGPVELLFRPRLTKFEDAEGSNHDDEV